MKPTYTRLMAYLTCFRIDSDEIGWCGVGGGEGTREKKSEHEGQ